MAKAENDINIAKEWFDALFPELNFSDYDRLVCNLPGDIQLTESLKNLLPRTIHFTWNGSPCWVHITDIRLIDYIDHSDRYYYGSLLGPIKYKSGSLLCKLRMNYVDKNDKYEIKSASEDDWVAEVNRIHDQLLDNSGFKNTFSRSEAIALVLSTDVKIRHKFFGIHEYILGSHANNEKSDNFILMDKDGYQLPWDEFWNLRKGGSWEEGWSIKE